MEVEIGKNRGGYLFVHCLQGAKYRQGQCITCNDSRKNEQLSGLQQILNSERETRRKTAKNFARSSNVFFLFPYILERVKHKWYK